MNRKGELNRRSGVYALINTSNGKMYIGATGNLANRRNSHMYSLRVNKHDSRTLQDDYNNGDEFDFVVLEWCTQSVVYDREMAHMDYHKGDGIYNVAKRSYISVNKICPKTGAVLATYPSQTAAAAAIGLNKQGVHDCIHGRQSSAGGFFWERA